MPYSKPHSGKEFDPTNRGSLSKNEKRTEDWHPEYKGKINIDGREYWLDAKLRKNERGAWMSLKATPIKEQRRESVEEDRGRRDAQSARQLDDDIPF